jgi:ABC-type glycerol-3-phosphate transport system substrate-binding protein
MPALTRVTPARPTRRWLFREGALLGGGAALVLAAGCNAGGGTAPAADSGPPKSVVFMRPSDPTTQRAYEAQAAAFNKKQSRIQARFEPAVTAQGESWLTKLTTMLAGDAAPDCFLVTQDILPTVASSGALLPLDPLIARDAKEVDPGDFNTAHLEAGKWLGKQVALTPDGCAILEYYNVNHFREAGTAVPRPTWTWADYQDAAIKLTKKDGGTVIQAGIDTLPTAIQLWPWLWSNGADILSPDFKTVRIAEPRAVEAVQFAVDLVRRHGVTKGSPGVSLGSNTVQEGKVSMWRGNRGMYGALQSVTAFKFDVVPVARAPQGASTTVTSPGHIAISKANKQADAAWTWHKFLVSKEALIIRSEMAGGCPSRKSATQHPSYADYTIPGLESTAANKAFSDVLGDPKTARFVPPYVGMNDAVGIATKHVTAAMNGDAAVPAALDAARRELEDLLKRLPQPTA